MTANDLTGVNTAHNLHRNKKNNNNTELLMSVSALSLTLIFFFYRVAHHLVM